jgi:Trehalose-6-phosphate synthase
VPGHDFVAVANRLPVDVTVHDDGSITSERAPGGLVTALAPTMQERSGAWVGWPGAADLDIEPFDSDGIHLVPVKLSAQEVADYYEGFSNDTLWPLYHDVIAPPTFHREWWEAYRTVNRRFAEVTAQAAAPGATVWVHDYQLQLVPAMLRELRPDVRIGYFHHIPFPPWEIYAQLPWRSAVVRGLLGADLLGFQRSSDASNFLRNVRRLTDLKVSGRLVTIPGEPERRVRVDHFPISIDSSSFDLLARSPEVAARAAEIRAHLGDPRVVLLGVDRLDYTKGIRHRLKAYGELVAEGRMPPGEAVLVQVASPSREKVRAYQELREDVELLVGRINGEVGELGRPAVEYLHHSYPAEEMAALYRTADVMLVTSLRDGMNLVAKEYVASRVDDDGVLVLSEFTGAADELSGAVLVNPHDIEGLKDAIEFAANLPLRDARRRMRRLRRRVLEHDVARWSGEFIDALAGE